MGSGDMVGALAGDRDQSAAGQMTPFLPTWARPEDIADAVCWLASDESKNVTRAISIDQGMTQY